MSCANDFRVKDKHYSNINYKIPCRWCINCRVDRRTQWEQRAEYEFKKHISGAFVTFTYEDEQLPIAQGNDGKLRATLNYNDVRKYIERLRKYIERHPETQNILRQKDFSYIGVGEYGQNGEFWNRPHYHILFMGLDFYANEKLFRKEWGKGLIDSLPILNGGIRYVLKYIDKQIMGKENKFENYGRYRLEEPKQFQSLGFGNGLYLNNQEEAIKNKGYIQNGMKKIYIPQYYKNKLGIQKDERKSNKEKIQSLKNYYKTKEIPDLNKIWDFKKYNEQKEELNREFMKFYKTKERELIERARNSGESAYILRS